MLELCKNLCDSKHEYYSCASGSIVLFLFKTRTCVNLDGCFQKSLFAIFVGPCGRDKNWIWDHNYYKASPCRRPASNLKTCILVCVFESARTIWRVPSFTWGLAESPNIVCRPIHEHCGVSTIVQKDLLLQQPHPNLDQGVCLKHQNLIWRCLNKCANCHCCLQSGHTLWGSGPPNTLLSRGTSPPGPLDFNFSEHEPKRTWYMYCDQSP